MPHDTDTSNKRLMDEEARKTLDRLITDWRRYTYEAEYREFFGGGDAQDRLRGDIYRAGPIIELQRKLGGEHKKADELKKEWIAEARKAMDHEDWHKKGEAGYEEFVENHCQ